MKPGTMPSSRNNRRGHACRPVPSRRRQEDSCRTLGTQKKIGSRRRSIRKGGIPGPGFFLLPLAPLRPLVFCHPPFPPDATTSRRARHSFPKKARPQWMTVPPLPCWGRLLPMHRPPGSRRSRNASTALQMPGHAMKESSFPREDGGRTGVREKALSTHDWLHASAPAFRQGECRLPPPKRRERLSACRETGTLWLLLSRSHRIAVILS